MNDPIAGVPAVRVVHGQGQSVHFSNVSAAKVKGRDLTLTFDLSWDGSWRCPPGQAPGNWDAAWLFLKYNWVSGPISVPLTPDLQTALQQGDAAAVVAHLKIAPGLPRMVDVGTSPFKLHPGSATASYRLAAEPSNQAKTAEIDIQLSADGKSVSIVSTFGRWEHAKLAPSAAPPEAVVEAAPGNDGVLVYRSQPTPDGEMAPLLLTGVTLACTLPRLDLDGFSGTLELWPFGLEMVYVPSAAFSLGDPQGPSPRAPANCFYDSVKTLPGDLTYQVVSEQPIQVGTPRTNPGASALLYYDNDDSLGGFGDQSGPVPAPFPKGFAAFYVMKRQITQGQYADFVNALFCWTPTSYAQVVRYPYEGEGAFRFTLQVSDDSIFIRAATRPARACNYLSWADGTAFAAWAALRPMSELEYEKACRGPVPAVNDELAWGSTSLVSGLVIMGDEGSQNYVIGNCHINTPTSPFHGGDGGLGPVEDDAFAANGVPGGAGSYSSVLIMETKPGVPFFPQSIVNRQATGLSYYGVAALSGNLWELAVSVGNPEGRAFTGDHGNGYLDNFGQAPTVTVGGGLSWPGPSSYGFAFRGGSWYTGASRGMVAARQFGSGAPGYYYRCFDIGFRAARTAP
jgi:formylglycine-generating enzyme required for sulfatase activity